MSGWAECSHCGTRIVSRGAEPAAGRFCMAPDCQRARWRAQNALRGQPRPPRPCSQCGEPIPPDRGRHATCSEECAREGLRSVWREYQRRQAASIPGYYQQRHAVARERLHADPDALERERARERSRAANRRELEAHGERVRERAREWWALNRDAALAQRRERLAALPPEEQARLREQARTASREWQRRLREWRATDPEAHAAYLASQAEYRRRAALAALGTIATELESRLEDPR